ncbi:Putative Acyl-coenzyme A oxidase [Rhizopus microsporus]|nr:Putative Acyl-coenzyme A oxidase [Rhizopus microsporus]
MTDNNLYLKQMSIDVEKARQSASFRIQDMNKLLLNNSYDAHQKAKKIAESEPVFDKFPMHFKNRTEQLAHSLKMAKRLIELEEEHHLNQQEFNALVLYVDMLNPLSLHYSAFMSVIQAQGTPEQIKKWYDPAKRLAIIGCYAQTELSHGSNVAGLKTVALFDEKTDEFIIHTPDLTAAKWWIGGLGVVSTHAVVQAQLVIANKSYGPHLFIVPIRSPIDHKPLPGIIVGDIGPKAYGGFATMDNGFAIFDHVRIPRDNMLMKFAKVTREGKYVAPVHDKLSYGGMVKLRVDIFADAGLKLAKAATITTRYCTVRRQFGPNLETPVIEYSSVQHRLMPLISIAYGIYITSKDLYGQFEALTKQLEVGEAQSLPEVHATSCALKSWGTRRSTDGIEECRKAMGGHGYSIFSGVADMFATFVPSNTYEGDNYVLSQQVARFLLKQLASQKQVYSSAAYVKEDVKLLPIKSHEQLLDPNVQLALFKARSARLVRQLAQQLQVGHSWSEVSVECWDINFAHAEYLVVHSMIQKAQQVKSTPLGDVLKRLTDLFCLHYLATSATFLATSTVSPLELVKIKQAYHQTVLSIAKDAIPLTDAFGFSDRQLNSALGRYDGRAYEALWEAVQKNPINHDEAQRAQLTVSYVTFLLHVFIFKIEIGI